MLHLTDIDAYAKYPHHRQWFNKLHVADMLGHVCGPGGVPVPYSGQFVVRPVINLYGMGAGASIQHLSPLQPHSVGPGQFWCELFLGDHVSYELTWVNDSWIVTSAWIARRSSDQLWLFDKWCRTDKHIAVPAIFDRLKDCGDINIETIGDRIIEVHLRSTPDPTCWCEVIPVWKNKNEQLITQLHHTHVFVDSPDYVHSTDLVRLGFLCK